MPDTSLASDPLLSGVPEREGYKVLGGVVVYQKLGQGGMGAVYRGKHLRLNIEVAVKVMAPPPNLPPQLADQFVKRFLREAQLAAMTSHQNLVRVIDVSSESGVYFLVMDYVDGESAGERLKRKGKLSEEEAVEIGLGAAEGLAEAHRKGIVHRDVKPDNIMIDKDGRVRITDLGLAKAFSDEGTGSDIPSLTQTRGMMGTPEYMPLEQFESAKDVGPTADVWSLGMTLYNILTDDLPWGKRSFLGLIAAVQSEPPRDVKEFRTDLSDGACAIIRRALRREPAERWADAGEMAKALRAHLAQTRAAERSVLLDSAAGSTRYALASVTAPASKTMTLISKSMIASGARDTGPVATARTESDSFRAETRLDDRLQRRSWVLPTIGVAVLALVAALVFALTRRPEPKGAPGPSPAERLEAEADAFYEQQLEAIAAERFADIVAAIDRSAGRFDRTTYGTRITKLREKAAARLAQPEGKAGVTNSRAASDEAVRAAEEVEAKGSLIRSQLARGRVASAEEMLKSLGPKAEDDPKLAAAWCEVLHRLGRDEEALERAELALRRAPKDPALHLVVGSVLRSVGRTREALERVRRASKLGAKGTADIEMAMLYWQGGLKRQAFRSFTKALNDPGLPKSKKEEVRMHLSRMTESEMKSPYASKVIDLLHSKVRMGPVSAERAIVHGNYATYGMARAYGMSTGSIGPETLDGELDRLRKMSAAGRGPINAKALLGLHMQSDKMLEDASRALTAMYPRAADDIGGAVAEYRRRLRSCDDEASKLAAASSAHLMTLRAALQGHPRVAVLRPALDMAARKMEARKAMAPGSLQEAIAADLASVELLAATIAVGPGSFMFETAVRGVLSDLAAADVEMPDPLSQFGTSRAALFRMLWIFTVQGQEMGSVSELNADQRRDMR